MTQNIRKVLSLLWPWAEISRLRRDCSEAYQVVGYCWSSFVDGCNYPSEEDFERALDNLSDAVNGEQRRHDDLLPWPITVMNGTEEI